MSSTNISDTDGGGEQDLEMAEAVGQLKRAHRSGDGEAMERVGLWLVSQGRRLKEGDGDE